MRFKVLKEFISSILHGIEGKEHDLELDEPTVKMWVEHGLIEEVKDVAQEVEQEVTKAVDLSKAPEDAAPAEEPVPEAVTPAPSAAETVDVPPEPVADPDPTAESTPAGVTADETK